MIVYSLTAEEFAQKLFVNIVDPIVAILFITAVIYFFYVVIKYIKDVENVDLREARLHGLLWGIVGLFVISSVWSILFFIKRITDSDTPIGGGTNNLLE